MLTLSEAAIYWTTFEALLYGFSLLLFIFTVCILAAKRQCGHLNFKMLLAASALFLMSTVGIVASISRIHQGFISIGPSLPGGPEQYFADVSRIPWLLKSVVYVIQPLIFDGMVIYRAYIVWQNIYVVVLPILGWLGMVALSIGVTIVTQLESRAPSFFNTRDEEWVTALYGLTLATNLLSTGLLAFKIWQVARESARYCPGNGKLTPILRAIVESGAIYSVAMAAGLITDILHSNAVWIVINLTSPIICIVFNLIIVRIRLATNHKILDYGAAQGPGTWRVETSPSGHDTHHARGHYNPSHEIQDLTIEITQLIKGTGDASDTAAENGATGTRVLSTGGLERKTEEGDASISNLPLPQVPLYAQ